MKYKGIELQEFKSDKPVGFDPPKKMLVWDGVSQSPTPAEVYAYLPEYCSPVMCADTSWAFCAEIPEEPKSRRATNRELAKWLEQDKGLFKNRGAIGLSYSDIGTNKLDLDDECSSNLLVRKWGDKEWHEPTADYMGLDR